MTIKLKGLSEPVDKEADGIRIFISRHKPWPNYMKKYNVSWDEWKRELAPSPKLLADFKDKNIDWNEYVKRFEVEINNNPIALATLHNLRHPLSKILFISHIIWSIFNWHYYSYYYPLSY